MSQPSSPKIPKPPKVSNTPKAQSEPSIDTSLEAWIYNIRSVLHFPSTIFLIIGLLVLGTFIENVPRKVIQLLDNLPGMTVLFIFPLGVSLFIGWPAGLLAACISLIVFARIKKMAVTPDGDEEGFLNGSDDTVQTTKLVSNPHRWFVEQVLGETPLAISSDRIQTKRAEDNDTRTSSSSSMSSSYTSDSAR
jgi:hypothetical protein